jgi:hypothetical protein
LTIMPWCPSLRGYSRSRNPLKVLDHTDILIQSFLLSSVVLRSLPVRLSSPPNRKYPRLYILRRSSPERLSTNNRSVFCILNLLVNTRGQRANTYYEIDF